MANRNFNSLDKLLTNYVDSNRIAGIVTAITDGNEILHSLNYGYQDIETKTKMEWDSIFRIYSMTKPLTSIAAMMQWEEGKFDLDDPVAKFLPSFENTQVLSPNGKITSAKTPVTIRHILCHTAGITLPAFSDDHLVPLYREHQLDGMRSKGNLTSIIDRLGPLPVKHEPGTEWAYSMATDIVARLVEVWSDMPFEEFVSNRILVPLGMSETKFQIEPQNASRVTTNYNIESGKLGSVIDPGSQSNFLMPPEFPCGSGGLTSTATDYLQFMQMLLNKGELRGTRILNAETLAEMTWNHLDGDMSQCGAQDFNGANWDGIGFGLGFSVVIDEKKANLPGSLGEYGWTGAAGTVFLINPTLQIGAILLTQYMPSRSYPLRQEFRKEIYEALL